MNKKKIAGLCIAILVIGGMLVIYNNFKEAPVAGQKEVVIEVINSVQAIERYEVTTEAEFLEEAIEDANGLELLTSEGPYGAVLESVNGERAIYEDDGAYWSVMVNGEYGNYGISEQPVEDGDEFQIVYTLVE